MTRICFQPIQRLQPNFKADDIRSFMYTNRNGGNAKLRIFSFMPQRQLKQPNFMNHTYQTTKHTDTTRITKTTKSTWVSFITQNLCFYNWGNANSGVFIFKPRKKLTNFVHFIHHQFCTFYGSTNISTWLDEQFRTFYPMLFHLQIFYLLNPTSHL